jgi:hypothetical protein
MTTTEQFSCPSCKLMVSIDREGAIYTHTHSVRINAPVCVSSRTKVTVDMVENELRDCFRRDRTAETLNERSRAMARAERIFEATEAWGIDVDFFAIDESVRISL